MARAVVKDEALPAVVRLTRLAPLDRMALDALTAAAEGPRRFRAYRDLLGEGERITERLLILSGWAARVRILQDGRRQILSFLLPGDLIGLGQHDQPVAVSTITAITEVETCVAPAPDVSPSLRRAYAISVALEDAYLLAQITRLGRLNAQERIGDFLLEIHERLELAGLAFGGTFAMPLTQETIADALGLTSVHVNRMLQTLRRDNILTLLGREVVLTNTALLSLSVGRSPVRVTAR